MLCGASFGRVNQLNQLRFCTYTAWTTPAGNQQFKGNTQSYAYHTIIYAVKCICQETNHHFAIYILSAFSLTIY